MALEYEFDSEYVSSRAEMAKKMPKDELYLAVRIYLKDRINANGKDVVNLERKISAGFEFMIFEREIINREINERTVGSESEYFSLFQDLLIKAKIMKEKIFPVGFYS